MYSLIYCEDIDEYYIFKSRNVIPEEDGSCVVAFKASVIFSNSGSKTELQDIRNNLLDHLSRSESQGDTSRQEVFSSGGPATTAQVLENERQPVETVESGNQHSTKSNNTKSSDTFKQHNFTKRKYCYFCKKMVRKLINHLMKAHAYTKGVGKLNALSKGSLLRRKCINTILKKNKEKEFRSLQTPKFHGRKISKTIFHDKLIIHCGIAKYNNTNCVIKRQKDLRILGQILLEMKKHDSTITDLFSVFTPQGVDALEKIKNRILTSLGIRLLYRWGKLLLNQHLYRNDFIKKKNVEEFLKLIIKKSRRKRRKSKQVMTSSEGTPSSNRKVHVPILTIKGEKNKAELMKHTENNVEEKSELIQPCTNIENSQMLEIDNQHYLLRERNSLSQHAIQQIQDEIYDSVLNEPDKKYSKSKRNKKKSFYYCYFCKNKFSSLILHLLKKHGDEEEVMKFSSLPKGSTERKRMVDLIINTGRTEYNKKSMNSEKYILQTKPESCKDEEENLTANCNIDTVQTDSNKQSKQTLFRNKNLSDMVPNAITNVISENCANEKELELSNGDVCGSFLKECELTTTSLEFKDNTFEDDTKSSLWCMLEDHINCSSGVIK